MIVLDTDHISILQHADSEVASALQERLTRSSDGDVVTSTAQRCFRGTSQTSSMFLGCMSKTGSLNDCFREGRTIHRAANSEPRGATQTDHLPKRVFDPQLRGLRRVPPDRRDQLRFFHSHLRGLLIGADRIEAAGVEPGNILGRGGDAELYGIDHLTTRSDSPGDGRGQGVAAVGMAAIW